MPPSAAVVPLSRAQQLFVQRLLAQHVLTDQEATDLYESLQQDYPRELPSTLEANLAFCHQQLQVGFGLELRTIVVVVAEASSEDIDDNGRQQHQPSTKYHAIVNPHAHDELAQQFGLSAENKNPHQLALVRKWLELFVVANNNQKGVDKMTLLNARLELEEAHLHKLTLEQTEELMDELVAQRWLTVVDRSRIQLGPRAYMELPEMLTDMGLDKDDLPQFLVH